jgi:hypothetical protein
MVRSTLEGAGTGMRARLERRTAWSLFWTDGMVTWEGTGSSRLKALLLV